MAETPSLASDIEDDGIGDDADSEASDDTDIEMDATDASNAGVTPDEAADDAALGDDPDAFHDPEDDGSFTTASVDDVGDAAGFFEGVEDDGGERADTSGFFDGVEDEGDAHRTGKSFGEDDGSGSSGSGGPKDPLKTLAENINAGCARGAVIGMDDGDQKDTLQSEFRETFETFQLGRYGAELADRWRLAPDDQIHPAFGLLGAILICATIVVWRRPDIDHEQLKERATDRFGSLPALS